MALSLTVQLSERSYPITIADDVLGLCREEIARLLAGGAKVAALVDETYAAHAPGLAAVLAGTIVHRVPSGETSKCLAEYGRALETLAEARIDRSSVIFAFGGGVVGDLAGFVAASYLRGIAFYQVPTTLLAMVDSSVGGKTGINLKAGKNLVGAFHQPQAVFIGTDALRTLPAREFAAGMAEVIKYGLLGDSDLFTQLEDEPLRPGSPRLAGVIARCCAIKAAIVQADERELAKEGGRALLNLGHTFGHAIEQVTGYGVYLHGEAVAVGLCAAARLSQKFGYISADEVARIDRVVAAHGLPIRLRDPLPLSPLLSAMARDKKVRAGALRFVALRRLGEAVTQGDVPVPDVETIWRELGAS
ncbi:3-dehydroquinate synthase [Nibricoccus sp. IMCC34717]|uniref:3-dehydroquinate synthase n=1 Tax=Nibricoccus sp. IMCC34717 TaxID=3034021 RepID=UPI00384BFCA2